MKKLLQYLISSLVKNPKSIKIKEQKEESQTLFIIQAEPEDLKIIIGKGGQTIKALKELLRLHPEAKKERVEIKIGE